MQTGRGAKKEMETEIKTQKEIKTEIIIKKTNEISLE